MIVFTPINTILDVPWFATYLFAIGAFIHALLSRAYLCVS